MFVNLLIKSVLIVRVDNILHVIHSIKCIANGLNVAKQNNGNLLDAKGAILINGLGT